MSSPIEDAIFEALAAKPGKSVAPEDIAKGLEPEAWRRQLGHVRATAIGLAVAVPATIGFNIFMGKLSQVDTLLVNFAGVFLNRVQREINAHRPVQRTGATEM